MQRNVPKKKVYKTSVMRHLCHDSDVSPIGPKTIYEQNNNNTKSMLNRLRRKLSDYHFGLGRALHPLAV